MKNSKSNGKIKIQEEREKRQSQLVAVQQEKVATQNRLSQLNVMELKIIGALEQLDELEGVRSDERSAVSGEPSKDGVPLPAGQGAPEKKKVSEKKEN